MTFSTIPVRFFVNQYNEDSEDTLKEVTEHEFLKAEGLINYERHTKREHGLSQICLTKVLSC